MKNLSEINTLSLDNSREISFISELLYLLIKKKKKSIVFCTVKIETKLILFSKTHDLLVKLLSLLSGLCTFKKWWQKHQRACWIFEDYQRSKCRQIALTSVFTFQIKFSSALAYRCLQMFLLCWPLCEYFLWLDPMYFANVSHKKNHDNLVVPADREPQTIPTACWHTRGTHALSSWSYQ